MSYKFFETYFDSYFGHSENIGLQPLSGGDIHSVYSFQIDSVQYVIKVNENMPSDVFEKEAEGLKALAKCKALNVPEVLDVGVHDEVEFLLLEKITTSSGAVRRSFGQELAELHKMSNDEFGWESNNYIGSLPQINSKASTWEEFFVENRLNTRVRELRDSRAIQPSNVRVFDRLATSFENLLPRERPALLHGDLWSGNALADTEGRTWVIDPAVYFGHREMDLAMMKLFGGFSTDVFEAYADSLPLEQGWEERIKLNQLYPMLVHAVLFGGHYIRASLDIAKTYS